MVGGVVHGLTKRALTLSSFWELGLYGIIEINAFFDGCNPSMSLSLRAADEERRKWEVIGAKGLAHLAAPVVEP